MEMGELPLLAKRAMRCSVETHSRYNTPFDMHLEMHEFCVRVCDTALKHFDIIPVVHRENVLAAIWLFDFMKKDFMTYEQLTDTFNKDIAEIVYLITGDKSRTSKWELNENSLKWIIELRSCREAIFVCNCLVIEITKLMIERGISINNLYREATSSYLHNIWNVSFISQLREIQTLII